MRPISYRDQTVLITGASSGLGAELARRLAERGVDLVLVARRAERMQALARELTDRHGTTVTVLPQDLTEPGVGEALRRRLTDLGVEVTALVNNAGFASSGSFHEIDPDRLRQEVALDVAAVVDITRAFIEPLRARGDGFIVNLASIAGYQPIPDMAVYAASKAFVLSFTEGLWAESHGTGLRVLAVSPGPTTTEFFEVAGEKASAGLPKMTPAQVVDAILAGLDRKVSPLHVVPGPLNRVLTIAGRLTPRRAAGHVLRTGMRRGDPRG